MSALDEAWPRTVEVSQPRLTRGEPGGPVKTTHDLGFLFHPSFVVGEHLGFLTVEDLGPALEAARALAERFNPAGGYLQAFGPIGDPRSRATSTIDTMMNLPLLLWAARPGRVRGADRRDRSTSRHRGLHPGTTSRERRAP